MGVERRTDISSKMYVNDDDGDDDGDDGGGGEKDEPKMQAGDAIHNVKIAVITQKASSHVRISTSQ